MAWILRSAHKSRQTLRLYCIKRADLFPSLRRSPESKSWPILLRILSHLISFPNKNKGGQPGQSFRRLGFQLLKSNAQQRIVCPAPLPAATPGNQGLSPTGGGRQEMGKAFLCAWVENCRHRRYSLCFSSHGSPNLFAIHPWMYSSHAISSYCSLSAPLLWCFPSTGTGKLCRVRRAHVSLPLLFNTTHLSFFVFCPIQADTNISFAPTAPAQALLFTHLSYQPPEKKNPRAPKFVFGEPKKTGCWSTVVTRGSLESCSRLLFYTDHFCNRLFLKKSSLTA